MRSKKSCCSGRDIQPRRRVLDDSGLETCSGGAVGIGYSRDNSRPAKGWRPVTDKDQDKLYDIRLGRAAILSPIEPEEEKNDSIITDIRNCR
jgi:hypothetical protein